MHPGEYLQLADWRRRVATIYARWRDESEADPEAATARLREERDELFRSHPQSPPPSDVRARFGGLSYYPYDPAYRMTARVEGMPKPTDSNAATDSAARGQLMLDFNVAYHPSCAYDPRWNCPLAPVESRFGLAVRAGERLR